MLETEKIIHEVETYFKTIPDGYEIHICTTSRSEDEIKVRFDLPKLWMFKSFESESIAMTISSYFKRKGHIQEGDYVNIHDPYYFNNFKDKKYHICWFAKPKKSDLKETTNKGCFSVFFLSTLLVIAFIISIRFF